MMTTRRSLFTASALLAAVALLVPAAAQAQPGDVSGIALTVKGHDTLVVSWTYEHGGDLSSHADTLMGLGFNVYYTKGDDVTLLNTVRKISGAMEMDAGLGKAASRMTSTSPNGTSFAYDLEDLDPATDYVVTVLPYSGDLSTVDTDPIPTADTEETGDAPVPSRPREVMLMPGDKMLTVSWRPPVRAAGGSTEIMLDRYEVRWRWSQTSDHQAGDWTMYPDEDAPETVKLTDTEYMITSLENDIMYDVQVRAINEAKGESLWSPGDEIGADAARGTPTDGMTPTPALPLFGAFALGAGLFAAGRVRLRRRAQRQLTRY